MCPLYGWSNRGTAWFSDLFKVTQPGSRAHKWLTHPLYPLHVADSCPLPGKLKDQGPYLPGPGPQEVGPRPCFVQAWTTWLGWS